MDYNKVYNSLVEKAKVEFSYRKKDKKGYYESHHIIPKCMGGSYNIDNLVLFTFREHFIAHWLLHRANPKNKSLASAFHIMAYGRSWRDARRLRGNYYPSSRQLEEAKMAKVLARRGTKHSDETRNKISESNKGKPSPNKGKSHSDETKEKMRLAKLGKKRSEEDIKKISEGKKKQVPTGPDNHRFGTKHSEATREKLRIARARREQEKHKNKFE